MNNELLITPQKFSPSAYHILTNQPGRYRSLYRTGSRTDRRIYPCLFLEPRVFGYNHAFMMKSGRRVVDSG
jgi:hypothetical protein